MRVRTYSHTYFLVNVQKTVVRKSTTAVGLQKEGLLIQELMRRRIARLQKPSAQSVPDG